jgi:pimeloyl-ACP methyl ester carboxylesterase
MKLQIAAVRRPGRETARMQTVRTSLLEIAYHEGGPPDGPPVLLLHGWPDDALGWREVSERLGASGLRTIAPYLRGFAPTSFLAASTPRVASAVALARDALDFMSALGIDTFALAGHDWGARTAYILAGLFPERVSRCAALSAPFAPRGEFATPSFAQSRRFWYQWFQCTRAGADAVRRDPIGFARIQWETWSPPGWFTASEFADAARAFASPDFAEITLNSYRSRWLDGEMSDPRYDPLRERLRALETVGQPTLVIHGDSDSCVDASETAELDACFTGGYRRVVLNGVGHFPQREAPERVASELLAFFA